MMKKNSRDTERIKTAIKKAYLASKNIAHGQIIALRIYLLLVIVLLSYFNPLHFSFISQQSALIIIWLSFIVIFKLPTSKASVLSFLVGFIFLILCMVTTFLGHLGYVQRFSILAFWFFSIGAIQKVLSSFRFTTTTFSNSKVESIPKWTYAALIIYLIPLLFIYQSYFSSHSLVAGDWLYKYDQNLSLAGPLSWSEENLGLFTMHFLWTYPLQVIESVVHAITGLPFQIIEKIVWFIPVLVLSILSVITFIRTFGGGKVAQAFGVIFFLVNTYTVLLFSGGQMLFAFGVSLFPLIFVLLHNTINRSTLLNKLVLGLGIALLGFLDPRIAMLFLITTVIYLPYRFVCDDVSNISSTLKKYIGIVFFIAVIPITLHLWWLVPTIISLNKWHIQTLSPGFSILNLSFMTVGHVLTLFSPHWPDNIFGKISSVPTVFYILPAVIFASPFIIKRSFVWFFIFLSLVSIFLTKGINPPFGEVYTYLTHTLPGFQLFRDPSKFYVPLLLSYVLLFSLTVEKLYYIVKQFASYTTPLLRLVLPIGYLTIVVVFIYSLSFSAFTKTMDGTLLSKMISQDYQDRAYLLARDKNFSRELWLPSKANFAYSDNHHSVLNGLDLATVEPFNNFINNPYYPFTYLDDPAANEFLRMIGVDSITILDPATLRFNNPKDVTGAVIANNQLSADLGQHKGLTQVARYSNATTFVIDNPLDRFFTADKVFWVSGTSQVYSTIKTLPNVSLLGNAFIRKETLSDIPLTPKDLWQAEIIETNFASQSGVLNFPTARFDKSLYIFDTTLPIGDRIHFRIADIKQQTNQFLVREKIDRTQNPEQVYGREIVYRWEVVDIVHDEGADTFSFVFSDPVNRSLGIIDRIIAFPSDRIANVSSLFTEHKIGPILEINQNNPTSYDITVREAKVPYVLVFAETYNPAWQAKIDDRPVISFPIFNVLNGFIINDAGNYTVTVNFSPQRYIRPFAIISLLFVLFYLVILTKLLYVLYKERSRSS